MKERYYYYRDENRAPRVTVCLLQDGKYVSRGVAICAANDPVCKSKGRAIARGRAAKAMVNKRPYFTDSMICRFDAIRQFHRCVPGLPVYYKSTFYSPDFNFDTFNFSEYEVRLLAE